MDMTMAWAAAEHVLKGVLVLLLLYWLTKGMIRP